MQRRLHKKKQAGQSKKAWENTQEYSRICDADAGWCWNSECDDEDGDDGDMDNGSIHITTRWLFCPTVIRASTLFSHACMSTFSNT